VTCSEFLKELTDYLDGVSGKYVGSAAFSQHMSERDAAIASVVADKGYYLGAVDGNWGPESVSALQRFQTEQGIDNEGKITALALIGLGLGPKYKHVITLPVADDSVADRADDLVD